MDTVHEQTEGNLRLKIVLDPEPLDPRGDDQLGVMVCAHREYELGDKNVSDWLRALERLGTKNFVRWLQAFHGTTVVLPLYLLDHSGLSMRAGGGFGDVDPGGWDSGQVGLIFDTAETRERTGAPLDQIAKQLEGEVDEYDRYLRGEAYGFVIERLVTCDQGTEHTTTVESVWGFPDDTDALSEGRSMLETLVAAEPVDKRQAQSRTRRIDVIVVRDPDAENTYAVFVDGKLATEAWAGLVIHDIDPGAGGVDTPEDYAGFRDGALTFADDTPEAVRDSITSIVDGYDPEQ